MSTAHRFAVSFCDGNQLELNAPTWFDAVLHASIQQQQRRGNPLVHHVDQVGVGRVKDGPLHLAVKQLDPHPYVRRWESIGDVLAVLIVVGVTWYLFTLAVRFWHGVL